MIPTPTPNAMPVFTQTFGSELTCENLRMWHDVTIVGLNADNKVNIVLGMIVLLWAVWFIFGQKIDISWRTVFGTMRISADYRPDVREREYRDAMREEMIQRNEQWGETRAAEIAGAADEWRGNVVGGLQEDAARRHVELERREIWQPEMAEREAERAQRRAAASQMAERVEGDRAQFDGTWEPLQQDMWGQEIDERAERRAAASQVAQRIAEEPTEITTPREQQEWEQQIYAREREAGETDVPESDEE